MGGGGGGVGLGVRVDVIGEVKIQEKNFFGGRVGPGGVGSDQGLGRGSG